MAVRWKRAAFVSLVTVIALPAVAFAFVMSRGDYADWRARLGNEPPTDSAEVMIGKTAIRYDRYAAHPYLAEYKRVLTIMSPLNAPQVHELPLDTGGASRMSVCEIDGGRTLFVDRFDAYVLHPDGNFQNLEVRRAPADEMSDLEMGNPALPACTRMLGVFDNDSSRRFRFISKGE